MAPKDLDVGGDWIFLSSMWKKEGKMLLILWVGGRLTKPLVKWWCLGTHFSIAADLYAHLTLPNMESLISKQMRHSVKATILSYCGNITGTLPTFTANQSEPKYSRESNTTSTKLSSPQSKDIPDLWVFSRKSTVWLGKLLVVLRCVGKLVCSRSQSVLWLVALRRGPIISAASTDNVLAVAPMCHRELTGHPES